MNTSRNTQARKHIKEGRMVIVAELYKRGWSIAKIAKEVKMRLDLPSCSTRTIWRDIKDLLTEWRSQRFEDINDAVTLELARIDDIISELWEQWEKSKEDYIRERKSKIGVPNGSEIKTERLMNDTTNVIGLGNVAYMAEIRQQLVERRKLLGLYAAEKTEITGKGGTPLIPPSEMTEEQIKAEIEAIRAARDVD